MNHMFRSRQEIGQAELWLAPGRRGQDFLNVEPAAGLVRGRFQGSTLAFAGGCELGSIYA